ncbi:hypothetical protein JHK85_043634 [Glycine max]|nr:hypothetical protein JHK85_043634 [Glycine max]
MFRNLTKILHFHSPVYRGCPPVLVEETNFTWVARINIEIILMDEKANKIFAPIKNVDPGKWNDVVKVVKKQDFPMIPEMVYDFILLDDVLTGNVNPDYLMGEFDPKDILEAIDRILDKKIAFRFKTMSNSTWYSVSQISKDEDLIMLLLKRLPTYELVGIELEMSDSSVK